MSKQFTYKESGVDIDAGEEVVRRIKPLVRSTFTKGVVTDIGAFGAFFAPDFAAYDEPVLVSSVDGVGTKLKVAFAMNRHDTVGQDLVNHCVNDIAVCGAEPLYFLDYFSTGQLNQETAVQVIEGFSVACRQNGCALIGGETAEMPDIYETGEYDLAGTIVGIVDRKDIVDGSRVADGDLLIGVASTGLHTNGYSLARKVLLSRFGVDDCPDELAGRSVGDTLLDIHRSYLGVIRSIKSRCNAFVHVTGGGIPGNTPRVLPDGLGFEVDYEAWPRPEIFALIKTIGDVPETDMRRSLNLGIGLIAIVSPDEKDAVQKILAEAGETFWVIGRITSKN